MIVDLHTHSKYSRACSGELNSVNMQAWAQIKGIDLLSAADFTHPKRFAELLEELEEVDEGVYQVKKEFLKTAKIQVPEKCRKHVRLMLATEVSLIYKKHVGADTRVRKIHYLILAPNLKIAAKINQELNRRGNIKSDGRPILGLDSKTLLNLLLSISPDIELIPAHVWTPHFSIFGSKSGFDSVEDCFDELAPHIHALETGLSSDPPMNWRLSQNDRYILVSNSDAHSLPKLGREATVIDTAPTYPGLLDALRSSHAKVLGTIEFFPEEGKYHADGLRTEKFWCMPDQTKRLGGLSPRSKKPLTIGVLHRVNDLADRPVGYRPPPARLFWNIIPLQEIIGEALDVGVASKRVNERYWKLIAGIGPEFYILKDAPVETIGQFDERIAQGIARMREGAVSVTPGYDGEYGVIRVFDKDAKNRSQMAMF